jgi:hypothetical protein
LFSFVGMRNAFLFVMTLVWSFDLAAQSDTVIFTDRPTVTTSYRTMYKGWFQVETGFQYTSLNLESLINPNDDLEQQIYNYNTTLFRYGLSDNFELRLTQSLLKGRLLENGVERLGGNLHFAPTVLGFKWNFANGNGPWPKTSVMVNYGGTPFTKGGFDGFSNVTFLFNSRLFNTINVDYNVGISTINNFDFDAFNYTLLFSQALSKRLSGFIEFYGVFEDDLPTTHDFDVGLLYLINNTFQADVYVGSGFSELSPNILFGFGLSKLFLR